MKEESLTKAMPIHSEDEIALELAAFRKRFIDKVKARLDAAAEEGDIDRLKAIDSDLTLLRSVYDRQLLLYEESLLARQIASQALELWDDGIIVKGNFMKARAFRNLLEKYRNHV